MSAPPHRDGNANRGREEVEGNPTGMRPAGCRYYIRPTPTRASTTGGFSATAPSGTHPQVHHDREGIEGTAGPVRLDTVGPNAMSAGRTHDRGVTTMKPVSR